jgi:hypothetical protein
VTNETCVDGSNLPADYLRVSGPIETAWMSRHIFQFCALASVAGRRPDRVSGRHLRAARARKISLGTCENSVVRCPVVVGRDGELAALAEVFGRTAGGCGACVVVTGGAGCWKGQVGQRGGRWGAGGGRSSWPVVRRRPIRSRRCGRLAGAAGRAARLPPAGRLTFPRWAPWCRTGRPIRRFRGAAPPVVLAEAMLRVLRWLSPER